MRQVKQELVSDQFPKAQEELRFVLETLVNDLETANIEGLKAAHLTSDKFTKFGPRNFDRQDVESTNRSEADFFSSVTDLDYEINGLKIDVFGEIGIVTYYPHVSFEKDGEERKVSGRQTLVFLKTDREWKIVHEHGTPKWN